MYLRIHVIMKQEGYLEQEVQGFKPTTLRLGVEQPPDCPVGLDHIHQHQWKDVPAFLN